MKATIVLLLFSFQGFANVCEKLEKENKLIYQQFRDTKVCKTHRIHKTWSDCEFKSGNTIIKIEGALGLDNPSKLNGISGSGFYINSVDDKMYIRTFVQKEIGLVLRIDGKNNLDKDACLYNEAYISLDGTVYSPGDINNITYNLKKN